MQSTITQKHSYLLSISIKESSAEFDKAKNAVIGEIRKNGKVPGFKKGSEIPEEVIIRHFGEEAIEQQAIDMLIQKIYPKVLKKENIMPVAPGNIVEIKNLRPFECIIEVEVFPKVEIDEKKCDKIRIKRTPVSVSDADIDAELQSITDRFTHYHTVGEETADGADTTHTFVEMNDRVTITAQGYDKLGGASIPETYVPSHPLIIGSNTFIPGFEEKLLKAKNGENISFEITFPEDYHAEEFKKRKVFFEVTIEKIEKPHAPELTPDFIEKLRGKKMDLAEFRKTIKHDLVEKKEQESRKHDEDALIKRLMEITTLEIGPALLEREIDQIYREQQENLAQQGIQMDQYFEHTKTDEGNYKETIIRPEAERRLTAELILQKLQEIKHPEVTDADIKEEIDKIIRTYQNAEVVERLRAKLVPGDTYYEDIKLRLSYRKVVDLFWE